MSVVIRNNKLTELNRLRDQLSGIEKSIASADLCLTNAAQSQDDAPLEQLVDIFSNSEAKLISIRAGIQTGCRDLNKTKFLLDARKVKLLGELAHLFPIHRLANGEYDIGGLELFHDHNGVKDDETVASALGYIVQLMLLSSKYLEVPLRYQLLHMGSRSLIRDPVITNVTAGTFPLFRKGVEKERFERALQLLRLSVEQLLLSREVQYDSAKSILGNLSVLFDQENCPKLSF